ncbi:MAG: hypothetical protein CW338_12170, partial [Clostridiales bacterium]|nr:hypothetical protein [Clostridiales bacterium]
QPGNNCSVKFAIEEHRKSLPAEVPPFHRAWNEVPDPVIEGIEIRPDSISVKIEMNVGFDGADMVTAVLSDMSGEPLLTRSVSAEGDHHTITFTPSSSGSYSAAVFAVREGEHDKTCAPAACEGFLLPLTAPAAVVDRNLGGGSVKISWNPVPEADTYQVYVNEKLLSEEGTVTVFTEGESAVIHGLPIGKNSRICVQACRLSGETSPLSEEVYFKATEDPAFVWNSVVFGPSTTLKDNGCIFSGRRPAMIYSESGKGKIVPGSTDGIAFWYTQLDAHTENFILSGTIHVDGWTYSNGQEGMGIAVLDTIGVNGSSAPVWNNSMMGVATKVEYTRSGNKISMRLGIGALIKTGVTAEDAGSFRETGMFSYSDGTSGTVPEKFDSVIVPLETSCLPLGKGTYNLIGNWRGTAPEGDQADKDITVMRFELSRDNTGYLLRYLDEEGSPIGERTLYDADRTVFASVDPDHIYIGFFAARNARITVSDVSLTVTDAAQDPPAGEKPPETYPVDVAFESALVSGSEDYTLVLFGNTNGHIAVMNDAGAVVAEGDALAGQKLRLPVKLHEGSNTFSAVFQPDAAYLNEKGAMPDITEAFSLTHTIIFRKLTGDMIYVSPDGTSTGDGSPDHPVDIDTALSFASAGQTVVLKEGIYHIEGKLSAPRGNDGTEASPIRVIRDPAAASRPVLDFDGIGGGVTFGGEWWEISGFDVTNTSNSNKGVQI